ncbi:MAG: hypothetical protein IJ176_03675 [Prevotella sp.]|nr:hypothetical protein [Prevotella sp.]
MKRLATLLTSLMLMLGMPAMADNYAYLTITQDAAETSIEVSTIDKITFDASDMVLHLNSGAEQRLPLASLERMFFSQTAAGIATVSKSRSEMKVEGGQLRLTVADGERITLYNTKGEQLFTTTRDATYDLRPLGRGVFIVKMGQEARKLMNK